MNSVFQFPEASMSTPRRSTPPESPPLPMTPAETNPNLVTIEISDESSLLKACDILHDARLDLGEAKPNVETGIWKGIFIREFLEDASLMFERPGILFATVTFPMAESVLELAGVTGWDVRDRSHIGRYTFSECQPAGGKYRLLFCEDMEILLTFREKPSGRLRDIRLLDERGSFSAIRNPFRRRLKLLGGKK
jgi:hypothetical protein